MGGMYIEAFGQRQSLAKSACDTWGQGGAGVAGSF